MTMNGIMAVILHYLPNAEALGANYVKVVEDCPKQKCSPKDLGNSNIYDLW